MGYTLYREVKQYAPANLDAGELALLLILADDANENTRECFPGADELCAWMRMSTDGIGKICQRLAAKDLEVRVVIDKDKLGRPVYARKGQRTTYRIPVFKPAGLAGPASDQTPKGRTGVRPKASGSPDQRPAKDGLRPDHSPPKAGPQSGPSPHVPQEEDPHLPKPQRIVRNAGLGLSGDEEERFIAWANEAAQKGPHTTGWWQKVAERGDLPVQVARWRDTLPAARASPKQPRPGCPLCHGSGIEEDDGHQIGPCPDCLP